MPRKRKSSLNRKTKGALHKQSKRNEEDEIQSQIRLEKAREAKALYLENETSEHKEERLALQSFQDRQRLQSMKMTDRISQSVSFS